MVDQVLRSIAEPKTDAEYEAAVDLLFQELRHHQERWDQNRVEIARLRAESEAIGRHTDAVLAEIREQLAALRKAA